MAQDFGHGSESDRVVASPQQRMYSYAKGSPLPSPWEVAFPVRLPLGYWEAFGRRCAKIAKAGLVDEETAKKVWLSILSDYESYTRMGMWIPEKMLEEHRQVARVLGWM